jgi:hypothetical protein
MVKYSQFRYFRNEARILLQAVSVPRSHAFHGVRVCSAEPVHFSRVPRRTHTSRHSLRTILGGIRHAEYRSYYWVDAERIPEDKERTGEVGDRSLFANIAFGDLDPFAEVEMLEKRSQKNFGSKEGKAAAKGSVCLLAYDAELARIRLTKVAGSQQDWARKKIDLDEAEESHGDAKKDLETCSTEIRDLETALKARETFDAFKEAQETLAELEPPTPNDRTLKASQTKVRDVIQHFKSAREALELAEGRLDRKSVV